MAKGLVAASDSTQFIELAVQLSKEFPNTSSWVQWWMRKEHATMLFASAQHMDPALWESILKTTNSAESMHWRLYSAVGRRHELISGIYVLYKVAGSFEEEYMNNITGVPIAYKPHEPWKLTYKKRGTTHPSHLLNSKESDGKSQARCPPDTSSELVGSSTKPALKQKHAQSLFAVLADLLHAIPSYVWSMNSCWLDTSLELLFHTVIPQSSHSDATQAKAILKADTAIQLANLITSNRESLHSFLNDNGYLLKLNGMYGFKDILGWVQSLLRRETPQTQGTLHFPDYSPWPTDSAHLYFVAVHSTLNRCSGDGDGTDHFRIRHKSRHDTVHTLRPADYESTKGSVQAWLESKVAMHTQLTLDEDSCLCWCSDKDGKSTLCTGLRSSTSFWASIPVLLALEVQPADALMKYHQWDFPRHLYPTRKPGHKRSTRSDDLVYDLVGCILFNGDHYIARYLWSPPSTSKKMPGLYRYDGMKDHGIPTRMPPSTLKTHLWIGN
ncbi:hypothetical protein PM082_017588 [Marasmius tenuissimus]|nr:hypothetical protein PM082_017588 [Marasmius tenuissimus]